MLSFDFVWYFYALLFHEFHKLETSVVVEAKLPLVWGISSVAFSFFVQGAVAWRLRFQVMQATNILLKIKDML